jgi:hypothetical protein
VLAPVLLLVASQLQPLPPNLIPLDSDEGRKLLVESNANRDFFSLVGTYLTQRTTSYCGVASSVMVLNAMPVQAPPLAGKAPFRAFDEENVFQSDAIRQAASAGLTVEQLAALLRENPVDAAVHFADTTPLDEFRKLASENMARTGDFVLIDFSRGDLGQDIGAHWSPLAAYHAGTDRFLVLDVARFRYPPYWATAADLHKAMNTTDPDSGKSRGFVVVSQRAGAPGRAEIPSLGHRLFKLAGGAAAALFLAGALAGALLTRWRMRKRVAA